MTGLRELDKLLLTLGVLLSVGLVVFASHYDPTLTEWAKGISASVFGAWLLVLRGTGTGPPNLAPGP